MIHHPLDTTIFDILNATVTDPAAGANFTWACPDNARVQLLSCDLTVVVANAGASRLLMLANYDGTNNVQHAVAAALLPINGTHYARFAIGTHPLDALATFNVVTGLLPDEYYLQPGDTFKSDLLTINAADQITDIYIRYKQWIMD